MRGLLWKSVPRARDRRPRDRGSGAKSVGRAQFKSTIAPQKRPESAGGHAPLPPLSSSALFVPHESPATPRTTPEERMLERTLVLLKPDAVQRGLIGEIVSRFE